MSTPAHQPSKDNQRDEGLVQYLVSEFVEDYQEGHMTRRDALKRIAGILGSLALAENLLAACAPPATPAAPTAQPEVTTAPTKPPATSVPPLVKTISRGSAPIRLATCARAFSTASRATRPGSCTLEALP